MRLEVTDDSGFLAMIDPDAYRGFVGDDWELGQILDHFTREMAERHLLIWCTEQSGGWTVDVSFDPSQVVGLREMQGSIVFTSGRLLLTNYERLTMAAQFSHVTLPESHQADLVVPVTPGSHHCRIVQLSMEAHEWDRTMPPEFLLELRHDSVLEPSWERIPWAEEYLYKNL